MPQAPAAAAALAAGKEVLSLPRGSAPDPSPAALAHDHTAQACAHTGTHQSPVNTELTHAHTHTHTRTRTHAHTHTHTHTHTWKSVRPQPRIKSASPVKQAWPPLSTYVTHPSVCPGVARTSSECLPIVTYICVALYVYRYTDIYVLREPPASACRS